MTAVNTTKAGVLAAAKAALIETGYAQLSTRGIAEMAEATAPSAGRFGPECRCFTTTSPRCMKATGALCRLTVFNSDLPHATAFVAHCH